MKCLPLLYLLPLLDFGLGSRLAPVNVSVNSRNFHHVLQWDPAPGVPLGTLYKVYNSRVNKKLLNSTTATSLELTLNIYEESHLYVEASYNGTSETSKTLTFIPYEDTKIGPPELSLAACGNCIQINISLPKPNIRPGENFHNDPEFKLSWRKKHETKAYYFKTRTKSYTLDNLEKGVEYCVQVDIEIRTNKNPLPSDWKCIFTSTVEPRKDTAVLGAVAALLIVFIGTLMTIIFCLYYIGFLGKLSVTSPRALEDDPRKKQEADPSLDVLLRQKKSQGFTMTPEKTLPNVIFISSELGNQRVRSTPTVQPSATRQANSEEEEDEEEEERNGERWYMDRGAELSSGEDSYRGSGNVSGISEQAVSGGSGSLTERLSSKMEIPAAEFGVVHAGLDQDEPELEGATVSFFSEEGQTGVQGHATSEEEQIKEEVEVCESSNVNLFSVTLAALTGEEEEQSRTDFLSVSDPAPLLPTVSERTLNNTESDDEKPVSSMQPTHQDFTETFTEYEGRHADTQSSSGEEEEFSRYMAHI